MDETQNSINPQVKHRPLLEWQTMEYDHEHRSSDWFWMVGLIAALGIIISIVTRNLLFAVVILIAGFTVMMYGARRPEEITVSITKRGVQIKNQFYPYANIAAFAVKDDDEGPDRLILHIDRWFLPHVSTYIEAVDPDQVRDYLSDFLIEEPYEESWLENLIERLGF